MLSAREFDTPDKAKTFVREHTRVNDVPLVPEVKLYLADDSVALWRMTETELAASALPPPFWAFAWAGGQALARFVLDQPHLVRGRRVLSFASGAGLEAIAAAKAGAAQVIANDVDQIACAAAAVNADLNGVTLEFFEHDLVGTKNLDVDVILAGDICYEQPLASAVEAWLRAHAASGCDVLIGDPGRTYLPKERLERLVSYTVKTARELEDTDVRNASVWRVIPRG